MNESFPHDELTPEDLAILQNFKNMDFSDWEIGDSTITGDTSLINTSGNPQEAAFLSPEDMLALYISEADEDLSIMRRTLQQLEPQEQLDALPLQTIQRVAHKMKGSAGTIGYMTLSTLAHHMEKLTKLLISGAIMPFVGLHALAQTMQALETTLNNIVTYNQETPTPLHELEAEYKTLGININSPRAPSPSASSQAPTAIPLRSPKEDDSSAEPLTEASSPTPSMHIDMVRFEQLLLHSEQLAELRAPLENAQVGVEQAMQELHTAQTRLSRLEASLASYLLFNSSSPASPASHERPTSSLVARILDEAATRTGHPYQRKHRPQPSLRLSSPSSFAGQQWDILETDRFTETDVLIRSLSEALADVATASAQLRLALAQLQHITQKHIAQASSVRNDATLLGLTPMSSLLNHIEQAVVKSGSTQHRHIHFAVTGATTEIDQDILQELEPPLLQLIRTCLATDLPSAQIQQDDRIWFHIRTVGNEIIIEIGFSQPIGGGSLNQVQEAIRRLNGSIIAQRNETGSVSFYLRLPRSRGAVHGLLVRVKHQQVIIPFSQVLRIDDGQQHREPPAVILNVLLGFPAPTTSPEIIRPVLLLQINPYFSQPLPVQVDEVLGTVELIVKPLAPHLRRPGISGATIDGTGHVLLMVDVPELLRHQKMLQRQAKDTLHSKATSTVPTQPSILVADDSFYIRQSFFQILSHAGYRVTAARDGMEALELMLANPPDALILDLEMPNLNGYDLLSMMHLHPQLAHIKVLMLTSRSSKKHQKHAHELGIHAYLTKPCPQDTLLETIRGLLDGV